jgi:hypothetical protein
MTYGTDSLEPPADDTVVVAAPTTPYLAITDTDNTGFCLDYLER